MSALLVAAGTQENSVVCKAVPTGVSANHGSCLT